MQGCASHFPTLRFVGVTIANPVLGFFTAFIFLFVLWKRLSQVAQAKIWIL